MPTWEKVKYNPELKEKNKDYMRTYLKNKYSTDHVYKEKMKEKARMRKAMLRGANNINNPPLQESDI
jgi:hypothetical protein